MNFYKIQVIEKFSLENIRVIEKLAIENRSYRKSKVLQKTDIIADSGEFLQNSSYRKIFSRKYSSYRKTCYRKW